MIIWKLVNRSDFILSPFGKEKTASCKLYRNSYYDFSTASGGDLIKFTAAILNINNWEKIGFKNMNRQRKPPLHFWRVSGRFSYQVWKCAPAARYLIYGVGQQGKSLLSAGHGYLQIINQGSFQKPGIVYLLFFCNPFQPCRESDVCLDALIILFHAE